MLQTDILFGRSVAPLVRRLIPSTIMLPTEAFADAVAFLRLYDLSALVVANSLCSSLAAKASTTIRWEDFSGLYFYIYNERIDVYCGSDCYSYGTLLVAQLRFASENETIEFITAAFPNCVFEKLAILRFAGFQIKPLLDAIGQVIVRGVFIQTRAMTHADTLNLVRKFRRVKVSFLSYFFAACNRLGTCSG